MSKKRILLVSPFPPSVGGVSSSVQRLFEVLLHTDYDAVKFNTHFKNKKLNRSRILKIVKYLMLPLFLLINRRFDVIHFHVSGVFPKLYVSLWRPVFSRKTKFIITIHGQIGHILRSKFGHYSLNYFDNIICVQEGDSLNIPGSLRNKAVEIPAFIPPLISDNGIDKTPDVLKEFLRRDSFKLLINGFIKCNTDYYDLYGLKDAVLLLEKLRNNGKNADLIIIILGFPYNDEGRNFLADLKKYSSDKNLEGNICWIENTTMELWPLFKKIHIFLRPTKSDGDALSIRESLWLSVPVITSDVVPRPDGAVVYSSSSEDDFLNKTISVIDNYKDYVSTIGNCRTDFAQKIIEQYETQ